MNYVGSRIHQKRKEYGLTMEELGKRVGVNKSAVNKWEKEYIDGIQPKHIERLAEIFNTTQQWIMGLDDAENIPNIPKSNTNKPSKCESCLRTQLYKAAIDVAPENLSSAINLLNALKTKKEDGEV